MTHQQTYIDYNATAPLRPFVQEAMVAALEGVGNASSIHGFGRAARAQVEEARAQVAAAVHAAPVQVVFTSGGTEANNMALQAEDFASRLVSAVEHGSLLSAREGLTTIPVDENGIVLLSELETILQQAPKPVLVSVMMANNETGVLQPVQEVVALSKQYDATVHTDAVQALGKIPVDFQDLGVDLMTVSAHKVGGPKGVGALIVREKVPVASLIKGGGQERGRRAGTENISAIVGFGALAKEIKALLKESRDIQKLRDQLEESLSGKIYGQGVARLPNTICIDCSPTPAETKVMQMDLKGMAISAGSACSSGKVAPSHVLKAMGVEEKAAQSAVRLSLGWQNTVGEVKQLLSDWG